MYPLKLLKFGLASIAVLLLILGTRGPLHSALNNGHHLWTNGTEVLLRSFASDTPSTHQPTTLNIHFGDDHPTHHEQQKQDESSLIPLPTLSNVSPLHLVVDGVIFRLHNNSRKGIWHVWSNLIPSLLDHPSVSSLTIIVRDGCLPEHFQKRLQLAIVDFDQNLEQSVHRAPQCSKAADPRQRGGHRHAGARCIFMSTLYTHVTSMRNVLMIHDLIPEVVGLPLDRGPIAERIKVIQSGRADAFISVSHTTSRDLMRVYNVPADKIITTYNRLNGSLYKPVTSLESLARFKTKYGISPSLPYFLAVGSRTNYKNYGNFYQALQILDARLAHQDRQTNSGKSNVRDRMLTLIVGGSGPLNDYEMNQVHNLNTVVLSHIPDEEMPIAYSGAVALVYISRYEGFGLPVIEAMSCGCPVIVSNVSALVEVSGDAGYVVDENSPASIADGMETLLFDKDRRSDLIRKGIRQSHKFGGGNDDHGWKEMADDIMTGLSSPNFFRRSIRSL
jgi:glycosyltransferase involved in cell wall biosynthesis